MIDNSTFMIKLISKQQLQLPKMLDNIDGLVQESHNSIADTLESYTFLALSDRYIILKIVIIPFCE